MVHASLWENSKSCRWGWHGRPVSIRRTLLTAITIHCYPIDEKVETNINKQYKQLGGFQGGGGL